MMLAAFCRTLPPFTLLPLEMRLSAALALFLSSPNGLLVEFPGTDAAAETLFETMTDALLGPAVWQGWLPLNCMR